MATPPADPAPGVLLLDKQAGPTSHDAVAEARRALGTRRIGHTGTLDPFATGLLPLCVASATRLVEYFHLLPKEYRATLELGVETTTHDSEGEIVRTDRSWRRIGREEVVSRLTAFRGRIEQVPPLHSAVRVGGRRAYRLAREGVRPELQPRSVTVHRLELTGYHPPRLELGLRVSTGTYVRSLARDLGRAMGCGAHLTALRRTSVGPFGVERALPQDALTEGEGWKAALCRGAWLEPAEALAWLPSRSLSGEEARRVRHGAPVESGEIRPPTLSMEGWEPEDPPVALLRESRLVAVAERLAATLQPRKVLADAA